MHPQANLATLLPQPESRVATPIASAIPPITRIREIVLSENTSSNTIPVSRLPNVEPMMFAP